MAFFVVNRASVSGKLILSLHCTIRTSFPCMQARVVTWPCLSRWPCILSILILAIKFVSWHSDRRDIRHGFSWGYSQYLIITLHRFWRLVSTSKHRYGNYLHRSYSNQASYLKPVQPADLRTHHRLPDQIYFVGIHPLNFKISHRWVHNVSDICGG